MGRDEPCLLRFHNHHQLLFDFFVCNQLNEDYYNYKYTYNKFDGTLAALIHVANFFKRVFVCSWKAVQILFDFCQFVSCKSNIIRKKRANLIITIKGFSNRNQFEFFSFVLGLPPRLCVLTTQARQINTNMEINPVWKIKFFY